MKVGEQNPITSTTTTTISKVENINGWGCPTKTQGRLS